MSIASFEVPDQLTVIPLHGGGAGQFGPASDYVLDCWTPIVGPSTVLLWRRLALLALAAGSGYVVIETADLFASLGLGAGMSKNAIGPRTIARMVSFGLANCQGRRLVGVRTALDVLSASQVARLPVSARRAHDSAVAEMARWA